MIFPRLLMILNFSKISIFKDFRIWYFPCGGFLDFAKKGVTRSKFKINGWFFSCNLIFMRGKYIMFSNPDKNRLIYGDFVDSYILIGLHKMLGNFSCTCKRIFLFYIIWKFINMALFWAETLINFVPIHGWKLI